MSVQQIALDRETAKSLQKVVSAALTGDCGVESIMTTPLNLTEDEIIAIGLSVFGSPEPSCLSGNGKNDQRLCVGEYPMCDEFLIAARAIEAAIVAKQATPEVAPAVEPIDMVMHCPKCHIQHIDAPKKGQLISSGPSAGRVKWGWCNPPHRSHLCHECGHIWRPADVSTNGVQAIKTKGKNDSAADFAPTVANPCNVTPPKETP